VGISFAQARTVFFFSFFRIGETSRRFVFKQAWRVFDGGFGRSISPRAIPAGRNLIFSEYHPC